MRARRLPAFLALGLASLAGAAVGCGSGDELLSTPGASVGGSGGSVPAGGVAGTGDAPVDDPLPAAEIFRDDQVLEYIVTIGESDRQHLEEHGNLEEYVPASLVVRGGGLGEVDLGQVGLRHKGAWSLHHCWDDFGGVRSTANECRKLSYKFDFAEYAPDTRLLGLKKLNLHASAGDGTKLRELLGYGLFRDFGVDAPRVAPASLVINGEPAGLFLAVEQVDGRYAAWHFPAGGDGNLYKEVWPRGGLPDAFFARALETNEEIADVADMQGFAAAVAGATPESFAADLGPWVELEALLRYVAVDRASKNWDGIMSFYSPDTPHNFYWYRDDGPDPRFHLVPWDLDNVFWEFDPYVAPEQWVTAEPVPDFNEIPADCQPRPVWDPLSGDSLTPVGCDPLLRLLAATQWERLIELAAELRAGPFTLPAMEAKLDAWEATLAPAIAADPTLDVASWEAETSLFRAHLARAIVDFEAFLAAGYHAEEREAPLPEPNPAAFLATIPDGGLRPELVNNYEFADGTSGGAPVWTVTDAVLGTTAQVTWNQADPIDGGADLRFDFEFARIAGPWDEWVALGLLTDDAGPRDVSAYRQLSVTVRADRQRRLRLRLWSPAYDDTFGGAWSEFGGDFVVEATPTVLKLRFDRAYYPDWAREAWTAGQGWTTSDAEALAIVLQRFGGLFFSPSPSLDAAGEMVALIEPGYLAIDDVYFQ